MSLTLPPLDTNAKALSDQLVRHITAEIQHAGPMSFARYMSLALYAPALGYYRNTLQKFGAAGDFVTAPEISPLFSYCLANQCAEVLRALNGGDILEFGAGSGVMAADILIALKKQHQLPTHYFILELSAHLTAQQRATIAAKIPDCLDRVVWLTQLPEEKIQGVIIANEVLDAMPVHLFTIKNGIQECGVTIQAPPWSSIHEIPPHAIFNNRSGHAEPWASAHEKPSSFLPCILKTPNPELISRLENYNMPFAENYMSEINLQLPAWIKSVTEILSRGVILLMDYGFPRHEYYHPDRSQGTLMCHYRHHSHPDVLSYPGVQDITAHVDFTAVAEAACDHTDVIGFTHQAAFLMNCDLLSFLDNAGDDKKRFTQNQQLLKLTMPSEMGELFKVIGIAKHFNQDLMGFKTMNQLVRL